MKEKVAQQRQETEKKTNPYPTQPHIPYLISNLPQTLTDTQTLKLKIETCRTATSL